MHAINNSFDKRSKLYRLDEEVKNLIINQFNKYKYSKIKAFNSLEIKKSELLTVSGDMKSGSKIKHLTCEYQILLYLCINSGIANKQFVEIVDVSSTKFNKSLKYLESSGMIYSEKHDRDRRNKLYYISDDAKAIIDEVHERVFNWMASRSKGTLVE